MSQLPSSDVAARWEWRAFGEDFGAAETRLDSASRGRLDVSDEIYLLSLGSDTSAKVRDGLMDVKRRLRVNDAGLEQWLPVVKAPLPVAARDARRVLELLEVTVPDLERDAFTIEQLAGTSPQLLAIPVRKRRVHHVFGGCMAEITELRTDAGSTRTIAVESEDPALVIEAVRGLGLQTREIMCVARGLKAQLPAARARSARAARRRPP